MKLITEFKNKYYYLSNFFPCIIIYKGKRYTNVEAAFQAQKTDSELLQNMFTQCDGLEAKKLSKNIQPIEYFLNNQDKIMKELLICKFTQNRILLNMLLSLPQDVELINKNTYRDDYWGIISSGGKRKGLNKLGLLLMEVKKEIEEEIFSFQKKETNK